MRTTRLQVKGMSCGHCVSAVEKALRNQEGVSSATVSLEGGSAEVEYDDGTVVRERRDRGIAAIAVGLAHRPALERNNCENPSPEIAPVRGLSKARVA